MADPNDGTAGATPAQITPAAAPPAAAAPVVPAAAQAAPAEPDWLPARLTRAQETARTALLTELGITDAAKAKAFIEAGIAAENEKKTLTEKLTEQTAKSTTDQATIARLSSVVTLQATAAMSSLSPEQQAAVKAIAGEDAADQLKAIVALAPTWKSAPAATSSPTAPAATPPASTTSASGGPPAANSTSPPDQKATFVEANKINPFAAANFAVRNRVFRS